MWISLIDNLEAVKLPSMEKRAVSNDKGNANVPESDGEILIDEGLAEPYEADDDESSPDETGSTDDEDEAEREVEDSQVEDDETDADSSAFEDFATGDETGTEETEPTRDTDADGGEVTNE